MHESTTIMIPLDRYITEQANEVSNFESSVSLSYSLASNEDTSGEIYYLKISEEIIKEILIERLNNSASLLNENLLSLLFAYGFPDVHTFDKTGCINSVLDDEGNLFYVFTGSSALSVFTLQEIEKYDIKYFDSQGRSLEYNSDTFKPIPFADHDFIQNDPYRCPDIEQYIKDNLAIPGQFVIPGKINSIQNRYLIDRYSYLQYSFLTYTTSKYIIYHAKQT